MWTKHWTLNLKDGGIIDSRESEHLYLRREAFNQHSVLLHKESVDTVPCMNYMHLARVFIFFQ